MFVVWVFEAMYLWTAININVQSHLIVLKGAFWIPSVVVIGIFSFFRFVCPFFIWYISHWQCMAIQRTYTPSHLFTRQKEQTENEKRSKKKKRHHHSNAVAAASYFSITFVCGRALLFSCHSPLSWHIRYQVQCVCIRVYIVCAYRKQR